MDRFVSGQQVVTEVGHFGTITHADKDFHVTVNLPWGSQEMRRLDILTRAEALYRAHRLIQRIAADLDDLALEDACEQMNTLIERAMQASDAADAVKGLS